MISVKIGITYIISHNYANIKVDSYDSLPLDKTMTFYDVTMLIKSVFNKDKNNYYYNIFLVDWRQRSIMNHTNLLSDIKIGNFFWHLVILILKKINFTAIKVLFLKDVDTEKVLVSNIISSGKNL